MKAARTAPVLVQRRSRTSGYRRPCSSRVWSASRVGTHPSFFRAGHRLYRSWTVHQCWCSTFKTGANRKKVQDRLYGIRSLKRCIGFGEWRSVFRIADARTTWLAFSSRGRYSGRVLRRPGDRILCAYVSQLLPVLAMRGGPRV